MSPAETMVQTCPRYVWFPARLLVPPSAHWESVGQVPGGTAAVGAMLTLLNEAGTVTFMAAALAAMPTRVGPAVAPPMSMAAVVPATGVQFHPSEDIAALY